VLSADVPEESSRLSVQQLENFVGWAQFWCEEPAVEGSSTAAILYSMRWRTGSQWSTSRRTGVMCRNFSALTTNWAAAFRTICSRRMTAADMSVSFLKHYYDFSITFNVILRSKWWRRMV